MDTAWTPQPLTSDHVAPKRVWQFAIAVFRFCASRARSNQPVATRPSLIPYDAKLAVVRTGSYLHFCTARRRQCRWTNFQPKFKIAQTGGTTKFKQIRNATLIIEFGGKKFLIDPMLSEKGGWPGFEGTVNSQIANPTVDLPVPMSEILDVDAVIVSHIHTDHWDDAAKKLIPKDMLVFSQNVKDAAQIRDAGFRNVRVLDETNEFDGIIIIKTMGQHGRGKVLEGAVGERLGKVSGIVLKHPNEKTLYIAGDTVWYQGVDESLKKYDPDVVVLNSGDAKLLTSDSIIMSKQEVYEVYGAAPRATIIASHMEAVNHATLTRRELRAFLAEKGMTDRVRIPADGESYGF